MEQVLGWIVGIASLNRDSAYTCNTIDPIIITTAITINTANKARFDDSDCSAKSIILLPFLELKLICFLQISFKLKIYFLFICK